MVLGHYYQLLQCVIDSGWTEEDGNGCVAPWRQSPEEAPHTLLDGWVWLCAVADQLLETQASLGKHRRESVSPEAAAGKQEGPSLLQSCKI